MSAGLYIVDTSALFAAWVERYPPEFFGAVWRFVEGLGERLIVCEEVMVEVGRHAEVDRVGNPSEIGGQIDAMRAWLSESSANTGLSMLSLDPGIATEVQRAMNRINSGWPHWRAVRSDDKADPWVIAYAWGLDGTVVSEEQRRESGSGVTIPNVCAGLGVPHLNLLELFREEGFSGQP